MAKYNLPTNIDSSYADNPADSSVEAHQQHHDTLHALANRVENDGSDVVTEASNYTVTGTWDFDTPPTVDGAEPRMWLRPEAYGAVGDDATNDLAALQACATAAAAAGCGVAITGDHYVASVWAVTSGLHVKFMGGKIRVNGTGAAISVGGTGSHVHGRGTIQNDHTGGCIGLSVRASATDTLIEGLTFQGGTYMQGVDVNSAGISYLTIRDCTFDGIGYGILTNSGANDLHHVTVRDCNFKAISADAIEFNHPNSLGTAHHFAVHGGFISVPAGSGSGSTSGFGIGAAGVHFLTISGVTITEARHQGIHLEDGCFDAVITGCNIHNVGNSGAVTEEDGIWVMEVDYLTVAGCNIHDCYRYAIALDSATGDGVNVANIVGNTIHDVTAGILVSSERGGRVNVSDNVIRTATTGIYVAATPYSISRNVIHSATTGVVIASIDGGDNAVKDNQFRSVTTHYNCAGSTPAYVHGDNNSVSVTMVGSAANTPYGVLMALGTRLKGRAAVKIRSGTAYVMRTYELSWDGSALTATGGPTELASGVLAGLEVRANAGNLEARCFNAGSANLVMSVQFDGHVTYV